MDEFQHFERLDTGQEFEGGQWIDGEFFHRGKKKGKVQQTQEDRLYGVFQGSSDEEGGKGGRKRKRRDGDDTAVLHKPVGFVSTGVITDVLDDHEETDKLHGPQQRPREPEGTAAFPGFTVPSVVLPRQRGYQACQAASAPGNLDSYPSSVSSVVPGTAV